MSFARWTTERFLARLASPDPTPGGGSATALAGALGTALGSMVCAILLERRGLPRGERQRLQAARRALERSRRRLMALVAEDAGAYRRLVTALRTRRGLRRARQRAVRCPIRICEETAQASRIMKTLFRRTGPYLGSDVKGGRALLKGAFDSAFVTADVNLRGVDRSRQSRLVRRRLTRLKRSLEP